MNFDLDSELSLTSVKGVQNKAIAEEFQKFQKYANGTKVVAKATESDTATTASNAEKVNGHTVGTDVPSNAVFTDTVYDDSTVKASIQNIVNGTTQVGNATKATQDAQGNIINETYAKKTEVPQGTVVDDALSSTSTNPVQNKVVKAEFDQVNSNLDTLEFGEVAGGANIWDEIWENGYMDKENGENVNASTQIRSVNYISVKPSTTYTITCSSIDARVLLFYDSSKNFIESKTTDWVKKSTFITPNTCSYLRFYTASDYGNIYKHDIAIIEGTGGDYEPYIPSVKMLAEEVNQQKNDLSNLKDGTTPAAKAVADEDGNNIKSTYATKAEIPSTPSSLYETVNVDIITDLFAKTDTQYYVNCERVGNICTLSFWLQATASVNYKNRHELFDIDKIPKNNLTIGFCVVNFNYSVSNTDNNAYNYINSISVDKYYDGILKRNISKVYLLPYRTGSNILSSGYEIIGQISWTVEV